MQTKVGDEELPFYDSETGKLHGHQIDKARKLIRENLIRLVAMDMWEIRPIEGYNSTTYFVKFDGKTYSCNCQCGASGRTCSHALAVELFRKGGMQ